MVAVKTAEKVESVLKGEKDVSMFIPYSNHITKSIVKTLEGDYVVTLRLEGAVYESVDTVDLNAWHEQINGFLRNMSSPNIALWSHIVRRKYDRYPAGEFKNKFARDLNEKYKKSMMAKNLFINELYLSIIYRPEPSKIVSFFSKKAKKDSSLLIQEQEDAIEFMGDCVRSVKTSLSRYQPTVLGCYEHNKILFSEALQFYSFLIDGEWRRFPLPRTEINKVLATSRPFFGKGGAMAFKTPTGSHHGAALAIQEYPAFTFAGILDDMLSVDFPLVVSQSFTFLSKQAAIGRMKRQKNRLVSAGDVAKSQVDDLDEALDDIVSNRFVLGSHHLSIVLRNTDDKALASSIGMIGSILSDVGMKWTREDIASSGALWAQLPGNFKYRPRVADFTSRNFAAFSCFHNFPLGRITGNQWGDGVMMFETTARSPYFFNFHQTEAAEDKIDKNHRDLANTMVIGQSGGGKTVLEMMMLAQALKFNLPPQTPATFILFDKDLGASIGVRAMGGKYYPIKDGVPSGFAPMQMEPTQTNLVFLDKLIRNLVYREGSPLTPTQEKEIHEAIKDVFDLPKEERSLSALLQHLHDTDEGGVNERLQRWCKKTNGALWWLFDNESDKFSLKDSDIFGFDVTEFLENDETRSPLIMYLFHRIEQLIDGRRLIIFMDEFWKLLIDEYFEDFVQNKLKTIRKQNGFLVTFTQSPRDTLKSKISHSLIEQTATKIFLPNPSADRDDYVNGFKLTNKEYEIVKSLDDKSRRFLIKQGQKSIVAQLDLKGFDNELAVLSGNTATSNLAEKLVSELGEDPDVWLPIFNDKRKELI